MPFILPHNWCRATEIKRLIEHEAMSLFIVRKKGKWEEEETKRKNELH